MYISENKNRLDNKIVNFMVQDVAMCIHLKYIFKVLPYTELRNTPSSSHFFVGTMNLNGNAVPIIDLVLLTNAQRKENYTANNHIILCKLRDRYLGIIIDKILAIADIDKMELQPNDKTIQNSALFMGTLTGNLEPSLLLNVEYLFVEEEKMDNKVFE